MRIKKLNQFGFDHMILAVIVVAAMAIVGAGWAVASHAAASPYIVFKLNGDNSCLEVTDLATCTANSRETDYIKPISGSSNFLLKDEAGYCLEDASGKFQSVPLNQGGHRYTPIATTSCNSKSVNQQWNWVSRENTVTHVYSGRHELANVATGNNGCLNAAGASAKLGTTVIIYSCNGQWNESWYEATPTTP